MSKILIFFPGNIAPYQIDRLNELAKLGVEFEVIQVPVEQHYRPWTDKDRNYNGYKVSELGMSDLSLPLSTEVGSYLAKELPNLVLIYGYVKSMRTVAICCKDANIKVGIFVDTWRPIDKIFYKEWFKKYFLKKYTLFSITPGFRQRYYLTTLGYKNRRIFTSPLSCNQGFIENGIPRVKNNDYFLTICRFSEEKNLFHLLESYRDYLDKGGSKRLKLVGAGPLESDLNILVKKNNLRSFVEFANWSSPEELKKVYQDAYCFILVSLHEPWGVVVNEAISSGLPIIASDKCGCIGELVRDGVNGIVVTGFNKSETALAMMNMEINRYDHKRYSQNSLQLGLLYSSKNSALSLSKVISSYAKL